MLLHVSSSVRRNPDRLEHGGGFSCPTACPALAILTTFDLESPF
jgi:hypothetical protein